MHSRRRSLPNNFFTTILALSLSCLTLLGLSGCSEENIKLGFVGGVTGRVSDLGGPARNGMLLAIEEENARGGVNGRKIETIIRDDKQDKNRAIQAVKDLIAQDVDAIIGPVTSSMAVEVVDLANQAEVLMMGVTVTTNELSGKDDYFMRALAATAFHAGATARFLAEDLGLKSFSIAFDTKNSAYSEGWASDFRTTFEKLGGSAKNIVGFASGNQQDLVSVAEKLLENDPEIVLFVTNSVDAALLAKLVRSINPEVLIGSSEWAGTERLIELGGRYIEGAYVPQYHDRESKDPEYLAFRDAFMKRFNHEPGFPGMVAYNATNIVLEGLRIKEDDESLKDAILRKAQYPSIQLDLVMDKYGDANSRTYVTRVTDGRFVLQKQE